MNLIQSVYYLLLFGAFVFTDIFAKKQNESTRKIRRMNSADINSDEIIVKAKNKKKPGKKKKGKKKKGKKIKPTRCKFILKNSYCIRI